MARARRLALTISNAVLGLAPLGAEDWATAMLHEIDFIKNDWTALFWALGSTRILLAQPEIELASPCPAPWSVADLASKVKRQMVFGCGLASSVSLTFGGLLYAASGPIQRIACCIGLAGMLYIWGQLLYRRLPSASAKSDSPARTASYRKALERQRDFHQGFWFWSRILIVISGFILFCIGGAVVHPEIFRDYAAVATCFITVPFIAARLNLRIAREYQRQIELSDTTLTSP